MDYPCISIAFGGLIMITSAPSDCTVIGFFYPVVAKGAARIRTQISAAHSIEDLDKAIAAFIKVGKKLNVIK